MNLPPATAALAAAGLVLALLGAACKRDPAPASSEHAAPASSAMARSVIRLDVDLLRSGRVRIGAVERRAPRRELRTAGEVRSSEVGEADVGALVSGRVASLEVGEGARVKKGQIVAWVDAPEVGRATADLLRARARAKITAQKYARQLELERERATSKNAVDEARAESEIARADLAAARTFLHNLGGQEPPEGAGEQGPISVRVPVRAPIPGIVAHHEAVLGAPVSPDRTLFRIVAERKVAIIAKVPDGAPKPRPGSAATIRSRGQGTQAERECPAHAVGELGAIEEATRSLPLRLEPDVTCTWLAPGGYVDVFFPLDEIDGGTPELVVAADAVVDIKGVPSIFVATAREGEFERRTVRLRSAIGADAVIETGANEGERVVTQGALLLKGELLRSELEGH